MQVNDVVFIRDLRVDAVIGAFEWERSIRQQLVIGVEMSTDVARAADRDDLADVVVDYSSVVRLIREFVEASEFALVESLADALADTVLSQFSITWLRLRVEKPRPDDGYVAGVTIERSGRGR